MVRFLIILYYNTNHFTIHTDVGKLLVNIKEILYG